MGLKISKGRLRKPLRVVLYGVEGIGKTTLASQFPRPVFLDTEGSTGHFDVERVPNPRDEHDEVIRKWVDLLGVMHQLIRDREGYETVVIDSADWAESLATTHLLESDKEKKRTSIEDYGYGKGYVMLAEIVSKCLATCDEMVRAGLHVVWVAHSKSVRVSPPDQTDGFDRWELKLHKQVAPLFKEWCDLLLFLNYRTIVTEGDDGRMKGRGGKERIMYAQRAAAWDAKNRFGLPESMPMSIDTLRPLFTGTAPAAAPSDEPPLHERMATFIAEATTVATLGKVADKIDAYESDGQLTADQADALRAAIAARHDVLEPKEAANVVA
jgi:hypothetical protein